MSNNRYNDYSFFHSTLYEDERVKVWGLWLRLDSEDMFEDPGGMNVGDVISFGSHATDAHAELWEVVHRVMHNSEAFSPKDRDDWQALNVLTMLSRMDRINYHFSEVDASDLTMYGVSF